MEVTPESKLLGKKFKITRDEATLRLSQEIFAERLGEIYNEIHGKNAHKKGHRGDEASFMSGSSIKRYEKGEIPSNKVNMLVDLYVTYSELSKDYYLNPKVSSEEFRKKYSGAYDETLAEEADPDEYDTKKELEKAIENYHQKIQAKNKKIFKQLEKFYIPLEIMESPELAGSIIGESLDLNGDWSGYEDLFEDDEEIISQEPRHFNNIKDLVAQESQFVLLGEAGSGKTKCLQWLVLNNIKKYQSGNKITIYIPLTEYRPAEDLITLIGNKSGLSRGDINYLLKSQHIILLFDSLNECQIQHQEICARQIQQFIKEWPDIPIILTTRTISWLQNIELPVFTIQPLTYEQQVDFLKPYLNDKNRTDVVLNQLHDQPGGKLIASSPWMLFMITEIIKNGKDLPNGRVQIYHRYFQQWYEREIRKAKRVYSFLPWNKEQVFRKLTHLAAHMRLNGYVKEAPISWISETMGDEWISDEKLFYVIGQGLILTADLENDSLSFFHETLQEYLAAEYILKYPEFFEEISQDKMETWHIILAYVFELDSDPSPELIKVVWRLSPLLVALLIDDIQILQDLPIPNINPFLKNILYLLIKPERSNITYLRSYKKISLKSDGAILMSAAVEYLLQINSTAQKKMRLLKSHWIQYPPPILFDLAYMRLLQRNDFPEEEIERILDYVAQRNNTKYIYNLISLRWAIPEDFRRLLPSMIENISLKDAHHLINNGIATPEDFRRLMPSIIENTTPHDVYYLIKNGIATPDEFQQNLPLMIEGASPRDANYLIKANLADKENFAHLLLSWFYGYNKTGKKHSKENREYRKQVVAFGLATEEYINLWIEKAGPIDACYLVKKGYANVDDFFLQRFGWVKRVAPRRAKLMIDAGFAYEGDFINRIKEWKKKAKKNKRLRSQLIQYGFASKEEFR